MQTAAARDEGIDEVTVESVGEGTQAFECDAILGFGIFLLDDELPRGSHFRRYITRGKSDGLPYSSHPSLVWAGNMWGRLEGCEGAFELSDA